MARLPRLSIPYYPHHVIQRGNNRQPIFQEAGDYEVLLSLIWDYAGAMGVAIHGYVLMSNHVHLLATPQEVDSLPRMMQAVGRRYVRYFNDRTQRTGTLWEGRYRSTLIQPERYLLACMAYMDLNPVRAALVERPLDYPWSSYRHYVGAATDKRLTPHACYWALGNTPFAREASYAEWVAKGLTAQQQQQLTDSGLHGWVLGDEGFIEELQKHTGRRLQRASPGRPRKVAMCP